jgi:CheY-like chemotaxis protein
MRRSLSRAFLQLGESARPAPEEHGGVHGGVHDGIHARATLFMLDDPTMDAATVLDRLRQENRDRIRTEQDLLPHLTEVSDTGPETWEDALRVTAMLTALREGSSRQRQAAVLQATASQSPDQQPVAALVASYLEEPDENAAGALRWPVWGRTPYPHSSTVPTDRRWRGVVSSRSSA